MIYLLGNSVLWLFCSIYYLQNNISLFILIEGKQLYFSNIAIFLIIVVILNDLLSIYFYRDSFLFGSRFLIQNLENIILTP